MLFFLGGEGKKVNEEEKNTDYDFTATTSISKSSVVSLSLRLKAPKVAPKISTDLKFNDFNIHVISEGT